jgi:hypothetical protein
MRKRSLESGKTAVPVLQVLADGYRMSNGRGFIGTLACDPVSSTLYTLSQHTGAFYTDDNGPNNGFAPSKLLPILEIHGGADKTGKYEGGRGDDGELPAIAK